MRIIGLAVMLALSLALAPLAVEAQPASRKPRLCFLTFDPGTLRSTRYGPFFQGLRDLGYVDGQTLSIDYLSADGQAERLPALATECVRLKHGHHRRHYDALRASREKRDPHGSGAERLGRTESPGCPRHSRGDCSGGALRMFCPAGPVGADGCVAP